MGYDIVLCKVLAVDLKKRQVTLKPLNSQFIDVIDTKAASGLKFASSYAPYLSTANPQTEKINNIPMGIVNYPQPGDRVLALVWMSDITAQDRLYTTLSQNPLTEVIILARVQWDHPSISPYDHIIGDMSGAKLHFNHGWLDTEEGVASPPPDYLEEGKAAKPHQLRTGHVTLVGNRLVSLSGRKFLPFGLFSHLLGQAGDLDPIVFPEAPSKGTDGGDKKKEEKGTSWSEIFTQDPTVEVFDKLPDSPPGIGDGKFLQPPCPEPGAMMQMHDSGYKVLVGVDGHTREYVPKGRLIIIGQDASDTEKKMSFDPEGQNESGTYPDVAEGVLEIHLVSQGDSLKIKFDPTGKEITLTTASGKFKVVGNIEATLDVKGATGTFG